MIVVKLAIKCLQRGWNDRAVSILRGLVVAAPWVALARIWLARALMANYDNEAAEEAIRDADLACAPRLSFHDRRFAELLITLENFEAADQFLKRAERVNPNCPAVWKVRGRWHEQQDEVDGAVECFRREAELESLPRLKVRAILYAAECLADAGRDQASACYRQAVDLDPGCAFAYFGMVMCRRDGEATERMLDEMRRLLASPRIGHYERSHLHFALGMLYDGSDDVGKAFSHFILANRTVAHYCGSVNPKKLESLVDERREVFTAARIGNLSPHGCREDFLICVVGMPRSGTSLVEQILASHSEVRGLGERADVWLLVQGLQRELRSRQRYPYCCRALSSEDIHRLACVMRNRLRQLAGPSLRLVTKRPGDFWELGLIKILFPNARFIHMVRDAVDTTWSCFTQNFDQVPFATDLESLAGMYMCYHRLMKHWHDSLPAGSILDVRYESLVAEPESAVRDICEFCGIPFQENCMEFHRHGRPVRTMSRQQVRKPIYRSSVGRSSRYREFLGPLIALDDRSSDSFR